MLASYLYSHRAISIIVLSGLRVFQYAVARTFFQLAMCNRNQPSCLSVIKSVFYVHFAGWRFSDG